MGGGAEHEPPGQIVLWFGANWEPLPDHNQPSSQPLNHSVLSHSCYHHCLFTLNYCFPPRAQSPSQELPVRASASPPAQLLRHAITRTQWGNLAKTHSLCLYFSHTSLLRSNYTLSLILHWEECAWLMCDQFSTHFKSSWFSRGVQYFTTYSRSSCPADFLSQILLPHCSLRSARWCFINCQWLRPH